MYLAHIRTIVQENFQNNNYKNRAEDLYSLIDQSVDADSNKFYSYTDFQDNIYSTVNDLIDYPGIVDLMEGRSLYLSTYDGFQGAPIIDSVLYSPLEPVAGETVFISTKIYNGSNVLLAFKQDAGNLFENLLMNDQGLNGDLFPNDGWFTAQVIATGAQIDYYIYAENDSAGIFSPERAAYEYYSITGSFTPGDVVLNELMASNISTSQDENGDFDDWIELFNTTEHSVSLSGLYLSDDLLNLTKWQLPAQTIAANDYLIIWADSDSQNSLHTNFKLSSSGETLFLADANGLLLDSVS